MTLTVLGSGIMLPERGRYPSGYLLEAGGLRMLLDCGFTVPGRLVERGISLYSIDLVCLTHFHTDHFGGLLPLVHARWVGDVHHGRRHHRLAMLGPRTLRRRWSLLRRVFWPEPGEEYPLSLLEGPRSVRRGRVSLTAFSVRHVPWFPCQGYRITDGRRTVVYLGDIGPRQSPQVTRMARGADLLLVEAGSAAASSAAHVTAEEALQLAARWAVRRVVLTHVRPALVPRVQRALRAFRGQATLARDGERTLI